ncbi:MAG: phosphatase PAP2 family protein [Alphaproteobacteria bacterium]|nr:MAG: phosphatase PAP2 family protein [Alphaproteobacteria bacterium]
MHFSIPVMAKILAIVGLAHMFYFSFFKPNKERFREGLYFCVSYAAIPGVWINLLLKDQWGRPRPSQTIIFGGDYPFSAAYVITGLSKQYGSFVSGHVALAMFVMAVGVFLDRSREPLWICGGVVYALVMSVVRIAEGGHYLSDVFLGGSMTFLGVLLAKRLYLRAPQL